MPRTNFKNVQRLISEATEAAVAKLAAERRVDSDHIAQHVKASEDALERLAALEGMIRDLIMFEKERLRSLQAHVDDINTDEPALEGPTVLKHIQGGKQ